MKGILNNFFHPAFIVMVILFGTFRAHGDTVYVWSEDGTITKIDQSGNAAVLTTNLPDSNGPVGLICDNAGNLYAGDPGESQVWKFTTNGQASVVGTLDSISGLAFDGTGNLYATIPNFEAVLKADYGSRGYELGLASVLTNQASGGDVGFARSLVFDNAGRIYVANGVDVFGSPYSNSVEVFSTNFTHLGSFATNLNDPWGLAFDQQDNLYVANSGTNVVFKNTILKYATNGMRSTFGIGNGLNGPRGLAFDSGGNLYVANSGEGTIRKFTTNNVSTVFVSGLNTPSSIAIFPGLNNWSATPVLIREPTVLSNGMFQFGLYENPGLSVTVLRGTNAAGTVTNWMTVGAAVDIAVGHYQFMDVVTNGEPHFYRVKVQ